MRLICISLYRNRGTTYQPGQSLDLPEAEARALLADSPGSFELDTPKTEPSGETEPLDGQSPANTAITRAPRRKVG